MQVDFEAGSARNYHEANVIRRKYRELQQDRDFGVALGEAKAEQLLDHIKHAILTYL